MFAVIAVAGAHTLSGIGGDVAFDLVRQWAPSLVYVLVAAIVALRAARIRTARAPWIALAVGITLYGAGNLLWVIWLEHVDEPPIPSVCDVLWLSLYPASYVGIAWLARSRDRRASAGVWLDGIVAGLGIAAIGAAVLFHSVLESASGPTAAVVTNLAYPVADLLLAALVVGVLALRGWKLDRGWALLGGGFLVLTVADSIYLIQVASGNSDSTTLANLFYMIGVALLALAAWQPHAAAVPPRLEGWPMLLVPIGFVLAAVGLLVYDHFEALGPLAFVLAILTVLAALARTVLTFRDVRALPETRRQATTDELTSLPNRRRFLARLDEEIERARAVDQSLALVIVDLDHFKELNDTLGHHAGDLLLSEVGPRLMATVRAADAIGRLGGDEFAIVLGAPSDAKAALRVADTIERTLAEPFDILGLQLQVAASVGIALYPKHADDADQLLQRADVAMYDAKRARTGREVYSRERDTHSLERLALGGELRRAIERDELTLHIQPKAATVGRTVVGVEALLRWNHPRHGMLAPAEFVALAEQSGLARDLTRWVVDRALAQVSAWRRDGRVLHVAVNLTAADVLDTDFPFEIAGALSDHGVTPDALVLEVTESSVMSDPSRARSTLSQLRELGVGLALDDFGTGYSSLTHLRQLPVDEVKVDRSFVARMLDDGADAAIVESTIALAHALGMRVVAEGVEDEATWALLAAAGCDLVQGYALSRPLPAGDIERLLGASEAVE
jgi:diguanylate cyclase (GGDEF)-like protein